MRAIKKVSVILTKCLILRCRDVCGKEMEKGYNAQKIAYENLYTKIRGSAIVAD